MLSRSPLPPETYTKKSRRPEGFSSSSLLRTTNKRQLLRPEISGVTCHQRQVQIELVHQPVLTSGFWRAFEGSTLHSGKKKTAVSTNSYIPVGLYLRTAASPFIGLDRHAESKTEADFSLEICEIRCGALSMNDSSGAG